MLNKANSLSADSLKILNEKATERPYSGAYTDFSAAGSYLCRQCGLALFRSNTKFHSGCGWPSFDEEIKGTVAKIPDADGRRIEIVCVRCQGHLGHIFVGEQLTDKNKRYCVNSPSLDFVADTSVMDTEEIIVAGGCFWGIEHYFQMFPGVVKTEVGYAGGHETNPTYESVCTGYTGHYEVVRVIYDVTKLNFTDVAKYFFEIHDPTQTNGQGPDLGEQYLSVFFYYDEQQKKIIVQLVEELKQKGYPVVTRVLPVSVFRPAEEYHQAYYKKSGRAPYCHIQQKKF